MIDPVRERFFTGHGPRQFRVRTSNTNTRILRSQENMQVDNTHQEEEEAADAMNNLEND